MKVNIYHYINFFFQIRISRGEQDGKRDHDDDEMYELILTSS